MGKKFYNKKVENKAFEDIVKKKKRGAPTLYNEELAAKIIDTIACTPKSIFDIIEENKDFPDFGTLNRWLKEKPIFRDKYECAKLQQVHTHIVYTNKIADDIVEQLQTCEPMKATAFVSAAKLRIESRQWQASRLLPRYYSDKAREEEANELRKQLTENEIADKLNSVLDSALKRKSGDKK